MARSSPSDFKNGPASYSVLNAIRVINSDSRDKNYVWDNRDPDKTCDQQVGSDSAGSALYDTCAAILEGNACNQNSKCTWYADAQGASTVAERCRPTGYNWTGLPRAPGTTSDDLRREQSGQYTFVCVNVASVNGKGGSEQYCDLDLTWGCQDGFARGSGGDTAPLVGTAYPGWEKGCPPMQCSGTQDGSSACFNLVQQKRTDTSALSDADNE